MVKHANNTRRFDSHRGRLRLPKGEFGLSPLKRESLWNDIRRGDRGRPRDYTSGSIGRAITLLAVPMVLEMSMVGAFEVFDTFFVAKLGPEAVAAVGITSVLLSLVFAVGFGLGMAATAMVARRIGQKDTEGAAVAASQSILLGIIVSIPIAVIGGLFSEELLSALGASPGVVRVGATYCAINLASSCVVIQFLLNGAIFRGARDAVVAMRTLWLANALNIVLDPLLIFGLGPVPGLGLTGAAIATALARGIGLLLQVRVLHNGSGRLHIKVSHLVPNTGVIRRLVRIGLPGVLQRVISTSAWLGLIRIIAVFGSSALAGYTIALRITILVLLPSWGMASAAATLVGQNLGAKKPDRAERSVWFAGYSNSVFLGLLAIVFISWSEPVIGIFTSEPDVIAVGAAHLRYVSCSYPFFAFGMVLLQAFNGAGDTWTPTWINFISNWLLQVPLAYLLSIYFDIGIGGCFIAIAITYVTSSLVSVVAFRRGKWRGQEI